MEKAFDRPANRLPTSLEYVVRDEITLNQGFME